MASEKVFKYLVDTNRPYSCADVTANLRGAFSKTVVQKTLDALSESGKIRCKLYGKQKVYAAIQTDVDESSSDIEDYDAKIKSLTDDIATKVTSLRTAECNLKALTAAPTTESARSQITDTKNRIDSLSTKLETLRDSIEVISADDKKKVLGEHAKLYREYRKRKRICSDMIEAVLEGYPKSKKNFLEELCIETDEMVEFKATAP